MNAQTIAFLSPDVFDSLIKGMSLKEQNSVSNWDVKLRIIKGYSFEKTASIIDRAYKIYFMRRNNAQR